MKPAAFEDAWVVTYRELRKNKQGRTIEHKWDGQRGTGDLPTCTCRSYLLQITMDTPYGPHTWVQHYHEPFDLPKMWEYISERRRARAGV